MGNQYVSGFDLLENGLKRARRVDLNNARQRLEFVLQSNPGVDPERLKVPPELQDLMHCVSKYCYQETFKDAARFLTGGAVCEAIAYSGFQGSIALDKMHHDLGTVSLLGLAAIAVIPGIQLLGYGIYFSILGVKDWLNFKRDKFCKPLTDRERTLANYVLMRDKKE